LPEDVSKNARQSYRAVIYAHTNATPSTIKTSFAKWHLRKDCYVAMAVADSAERRASALDVMFHPRHLRPVPNERRKISFQVAKAAINHTLPHQLVRAASQTTTEETMSREDALKTLENAGNNSHWVLRKTPPRHPARELQRNGEISTLRNPIMR
jgi:hypothetical protein